MPSAPNTTMPFLGLSLHSRALLGALNSHHNPIIHHLLLDFPNSPLFNKIHNRILQELPESKIVWTELEGYIPVVQFFMSAYEFSVFVLYAAAPSYHSSLVITIIII